MILGLIHANHGNAEVISYLRDQLMKATTSAARHGACLGLGLAAMGTHDEQASLSIFYYLCLLRNPFGLLKSEIYFHS